VDAGKHEAEFRENQMNMRTLMAMMVAYSTQAATVVHTVTINPTLTDWSATNRVPQFDQRLGKLRSVQVTVDGASEALARVVFSRVIRQPAYELAVTNTASVSAGGLVASSVVVGVHTGVAVSNTTNLVNFPVVLAGAATTNRNLSAWIGTGTVPVVTQASARTWYSGPGDYTLAWRTAASAVATVAYTFDGKCEEDSDKDKDGR